MLVAILNLLWVPVVIDLSFMRETPRTDAFIFLFSGIGIPDTILTIPILAAFLVTLAHFIVLYRLRVAVPLRQMIGAVLAAMSVQWTVARAVGYGVWKESLPFMRTAKRRLHAEGPDFPAFWEALLAALLLIAAVTVVVTNVKQIHELNIFAAVLIVQSLPFLAAVAIAALEGCASTNSAIGAASRRKSLPHCPARPRWWRNRPCSSPRTRNQWSVVSNQKNTLITDHRC